MGSCMAPGSFNFYKMENISQKLNIFLQKTLGTGNLLYWTLFMHNSELPYTEQSSQNNKKSHTCEEGGGTPQNFLLVFIDELWKTRKIIILKKWKNMVEISFYTYAP